MGAGIDGQAKLLTARVSGQCGGYASGIADALVWAANAPMSDISNPNPARVLNLSLGSKGQCSKTEQETIDAAIAEGATVVVAAGNAGEDVRHHAPANCDRVIVVAALNRDGSRATFSNHGEQVSIAAPGVEIWSTSKLAVIC